MNFKNKMLHYFIRPAPTLHYTEADLVRMQDELLEMEAEYVRLKRCDESVLAEFRKENPRVSSHIHIRDLVKFKANRLFKEIGYKKMQLENATFNVKSNR